LNFQVLKLKQIGYSMKEIRELDVTRALRQIENARYDQMLWQSELLQANGVNVFEDGKGKGLSRYKDFFKSFEERSAAVKRKNIKPVKIDPANRFMEG
jgi:hypothetical protein